MSLDITGIRNVGDFYSQHYLDTLLAGDLQARLEEWSKAEAEGGPKTPAKRLAGLANAYFKAAARATGEAEGLERLEAACAFHSELLEALGYSRSPVAELLDDNTVIPVSVSLREAGHRYLWVIEAPFAENPDDADPFGESPVQAQLPEDYTGAKLVEGTWRELLDETIFRQDDPPRWVMLLAGADAFLIDRNKWSQGKYLEFQIGVLMGRRDPKAMRAVAGLLHRDVLLPESGQSLLDKLDEQSHKHAFAVSTDLKYGAQKAIELLANEALHYKRSTSKEKVFGDPQLARDLTRECIVYLYRLLFLFYVEARGQELGVVPMGADPYRLGYSLETLRDLELVPLTSAQAREGFYLDSSLRKLFKLIQRGFGMGQQDLAGLGEGAMESFRIPGLRSALFDEARTPFLRGVKLRNLALQQVLQLLSLSKEGGKERGRISYAQLGINQLGAVYEGLLSYSGFFAQEELYEVQSTGSTQKSDTQSWFVPAGRIGEYHDDEIVKDSHGRPVVHKKGTYLFRLAGRDREKSASYYTPEVLTRCLTKYTLKERLKELKADEILGLTICEPAMGSGAFLNEAINQLAHAYLERKQAELEQTIPADRYQAEWQRVKYHFAVNNAYGVDLNPLATELGKVSLWLNVLQPEVDAPYLDLRLRVGNSLIGARREVFDAADLMLKAGKNKENWLGKVPVKVPLGTKRKPGQIYHFLVPDSGMAPFDGDKVIAELEPENVRKIKAWRKSLGEPFTELEVRRLEAICEKIDVLWEAHWKQRLQVLERVRQHVAIWGQAPVDKGLYGPRDAETCEEAAQELQKAGAAGQVLKTILDYWCALYFWPIREASKLPNREQWMRDIEALIEAGGKVAEKRVEIVRALGEDKRFFHWELEYPEVFGGGGGMEVILGNPPWRKLTWEEAGILSDIEPLLALRNMSARQVAEQRARALSVGIACMNYLGEFEDAEGSQGHLNSPGLYPMLDGVQANLYKNFLCRAWSVGSRAGLVGLVHQGGIFDDPKGGGLRHHLWVRARLVSRFKNELLLFPDIANQRPFALTVTGAHPGRAVSFISVSNLFHPRTLYEAFEHDGTGQVPGLKQDDTWDLRGHRSRLVGVDSRTLALFAALFDDPTTPAIEARLPIIHSTEMLSVLERFGAGRAGREAPALEHYCSVCFDETGAQKDGTIARATRPAMKAEEWILAGPHFYVATPLNKDPNDGCAHNKDYSTIDLTTISDDYLPRSNYVRSCSAQDYASRVPKWLERPITNFYRHIHRRMLAATGERTLISCILPPGPAHINTIVSVTFRAKESLAWVAGILCTIPYDFFVRSTGRSDLTAGGFDALPVPCPDGPARALVTARALRLNCLTTHYAPLWEELYQPAFKKDQSANPDPRAGSYSKLSRTWNRDVAFRAPYARRQALVELDALAALSLGMTLDELLLIYRVQFPVLQEYERDTWYDQRGKIVFTVNKGLSGVGLERKLWESIRDARKNDKLPDWATDQQGPFVPPFDKCDRERDMAQAYEHFSRILQNGAS